MKIRQATAADFDAMSNLLDQLFTIEQDFIPDKRKQRAGLELLLQTTTAYLVVAELETEVVGMATLQRVISTAEGGYAGLVEDVVVSESHRGEGIGQALMKHLMDWAIGKGLKRVQLLADRDNPAALDFYQKQGWSETRLVALKKIYPTPRMD
ncbi:MAG: GNAT family N-acetyltransferase [Candidatus Thiodiazotropha sp.]